MQVNMFIQDDLRYLLILGQMWLMALRLGMQCRPDGMEVVWISSRWDEGTLLGGHQNHDI